jgi:predicted nucleic acid-binding protein
LIVADASLVIAWLLGEPQHAPANAVFDQLAREPLIVPANWPAEIGNSLRKACRTGRLRIDEIEPLTTWLELFRVSIAPPIAVTQIGALAQFAIDASLSTYDAAYLRLAIDRALPLATVDGDLRAAAARVNVRLLSE